MKSMIEKGETYLVMGLLDPDSIAFAIGRKITEQGGRVIYTVQNERMKRLLFDRNKKLSKEEKEKLEIRFCDITLEEELTDLFSEIESLAGIVHSIAYVNPKTGLGENFHTDAIEDLKNGFHISSISLASVTRHATNSLKKPSSIVTLTFDTKHVYPYYNWMGVNKAALEAVVRGLARQHGQDLIRVNAVSAGPLSTKAATNIPGFTELSQTWNNTSPIPWDTEKDKEEVANAALFLLGNYSQKITGQILHVDGGASITGGQLMPYEKA